MFIRGSIHLSSDVYVSKCSNCCSKTHGVITGVTLRDIDPLRQACPQPGPHKQYRRLESELTAWMFNLELGPPETAGLNLVVVVNPHSPTTRPQ